MKKFEFQVEPDANKTRLDEFIYEKISGISKMHLRELIKTEKCEVNGAVENRGRILHTNDFVEIEIDFRVELAMKPEAIPLEIFYEDAELLVVNKPPEMLMHPTFAQKSGTLLNALSHHLNFPLASETVENSIAENRKKFVRPGLIHRLDKQTSGLLVVAKTARAHRILADHFKRKLVEKKYLALVEGVVKADAGTIIAPVGRFAEEKIWNVKADGKHAESRFRVRERKADATLLELEPVTGRTNQLRIHAAHVGHPIVGDTRYGGREFARLCLHAYRLSFWHPNGNRRLEFETKSESFDK